MKEIILANNKGIALVDNEDYNILNKYYWCLNTYPCANFKINNKWVSKRMHRLLIDVPKGLYVDHIDRNPLNNQKYNLRIVTNSQNQMNNKHHKNTSSKYKGVSFISKRNKWESYIKINQKKIYLGSFDKEIDAAKAYNNKAKELFGEYANLNEV